ncbi:plasmid recombination protein [Pseudoduganella namucuonensis]|uniref:Plasmid recombination enzyme n=1 Tax=Pseudoduganella namucuonensis TaxID=1035707 RepID=A0A1I7K922_9BURK|nr:plasmid recombination protein [Pseudoduganella namucuonensis]SFU93927.1 Plasmid recombination enzyme [Pseudoduganella namucuonensis]
MSAGYALNIERLYGPGIVRVAAKHLLRELAAELGADSHIDAARIGENFILRGPDTSAGVAALAKSLLDAAGVVKCRKGAVTALELLFTLPAATTLDPRQYFEQATRWAEQYFGVPVLSCVGHMDEGSPHAHALLLPLVGGRMGGSDLHGGKAKLAAMQTSFHEAVGAPHGLPKYVPQKRLSAPVRAAAMALARETLQANAALNDDIIDALLVPHAKDPAPLLLALGIAMPLAAKSKSKSFIEIMTAPAAPEPRNHIGKAKCSPIGKAIPAASISSLPDSCVGKGSAAPSATELPADGITLPEPTTTPRPVQLLHTPASGDALKTEPTATVDQAAPGEVAKHQPISEQRQQATPMTGPAPATSIEAASNEICTKPPGSTLQNPLHTPGKPASALASACTAAPAACNPVQAVTLAQAQEDVSGFAHISLVAATLPQCDQQASKHTLEPVDQQHAQHGAQQLRHQDAPAPSGAPLQARQTDGVQQLDAAQAAPGPATSSKPPRKRAPAAKAAQAPGATRRTPGSRTLSAIAPAPTGRTAPEIRAQPGAGKSEVRNSDIAASVDAGPIPLQQDRYQAPVPGPVEAHPEGGAWQESQHHDADDYHRQRDADQPAERWNSDTGEFVALQVDQRTGAARRGAADYDARAAPGRSSTRAPP